MITQREHFGGNEEGSRGSGGEERGEFQGRSLIGRSASPSQAAPEVGVAPYLIRGISRVGSKVQVETVESFVAMTVLYTIDCG